jgi:hypothetical protein
MTRLLAQILTLVGLGATLVWAASWGLHIWQTPIALDAPVTASVPKRAPGAAADPARPALSTFSQSLVRPLFFEGRRLPLPQPQQVKIEAPKPSPPPPPPPPPPPKPATLPDKIKLLGVVMQAEDRKALVEIPPQPAAWFRKGDKIADWTITAIEENRVLFSHNSSATATLALYADITSK